jgi:hypothetical protein
MEATHMTIVILDRFPGALPPYAEWLRDAAADLVLVTARADVGHGYAEVRSVSGYAGAAGERAVLELARTRQISAIVATAGADLVRAGALRDLLGVPGQGRDAALAFADPVTMRELLSQHGISTVPGGPVHRVSDLYWYAHRWGYPVRVRERRPPAWPTVAVLRDEADLRAYTDGGLVPDLQSIPNLVAEPVLDDVSRRLVGPEHAALLSTVDELFGPVHPRVVRGLRSATGEWLVDTVACDVDPATTDPETHRAAVRVQAGLDREVVRWAS